MTPPSFAFRRNNDGFENYVSEGRLGVVDSLSVCRGLSPPAEKRGQRVGFIEDDPTDPVYDRLFKLCSASSWNIAMGICV